MNRTLLTKGLEELNSSYTKTIPEKIASMEQVIIELHDGFTLETLVQLRLLVHKLAGSAGTYGYLQASVLCQKWDKKLAKMISLFPDSLKSIILLIELEGFLTDLKEKLINHK